VGEPAAAFRSHQLSDWEVERSPDGGVVSLRLRDSELLAGEARPLDEEAAPWVVTLEVDRVRIEPARFEIAQSMVWPFRYETGMELVARGKDVTPPGLDVPFELKPAFSVRLDWPSSRVAVSIAWDELRMPTAALTLRSNPSRVVLTIGARTSGTVRPVSWWVNIRDGNRGSKIEVVDYDPAWPAIYREEAAAIRRVLGDQVAALEHGGSTSVPGLAAKPIIDMWAALRAPIREDDIQAMAALGYEYLGESALPDQDFFVKRASPSYHLHCYPAGHPEWDRHLAFRDWLRAHPEGAAAYASLKRELAKRFPADALAYTEAKSEFIQEALGN
jgi:GrpB-like predicted nucleotidyltransferase (UPF0157 family)